MFAFWLLSQRDWEVKCPGLLLAKTASLCWICCSAIGRLKGNGGQSWRFLVWACFHWPAPEWSNLGINSDTFMFKHYKPCQWMCKSSTATSILQNNVGDTNSALCLSSARIWSLGFRVYLQILKEKKRGISFSKSSETCANSQTTTVLV